MWWSIIINFLIKLITLQNILQGYIPEVTHSIENEYFKLSYLTDNNLNTFYSTGMIEPNTTADIKFTFQNTFCLETLSIYWMITPSYFKIKSNNTEIYNYYNNVDNEEESYYIVGDVDNTLIIEPCENNYFSKNITIQIINNSSQIANVKNVPMLVKISPDLADDSIIEIVDTARECGCAGIIATNTTLTRPNDDKPFDESGGLSGKPLRKRSTEVIRLIAEHTNGEWPIIGVGGISTADDAWEKITHGAWLVQIYSAMVFHGPSVIKKINTGLQRRLKEEGLSSLNQAIGAALR